MARPQPIDDTQAKAGQSASANDPANDTKEAPPAPKVRRAKRKVNGKALIIVAVIGLAVYFGVREVQDRIAYVSEIDARISADLVTVSSRVAGRVVAVLVSEGDAVQLGGPVAEIDARESKLLVEQLEAQRKGAEAELEKLRAQRQMIDRQSTTRIETQLSQTNAAAASVTTLEPQVELANSELARATSLFSKRVIPKQQLDKARTEARRVDGEYRTALAELSEARSKLEEARTERAQLQVLDQELEILRQRAVVLKSKLEQQRLDLTDRVIQSPIGGVLDKLFIEPGEYVTPGQRLALVHNPRQIWIEANIKETEIRRLEIGQPVEIHVDSFPDEEFKGQVAVIGNATTGSFALLPNPNPSGNFTKVTQRLPVRIAVEQQDNKLRPGMMVEVKIDVRD